MSKHTPAPWYVERDDGLPYVCGADDSRVCDITSGYGEGSALAKADAKLIAAAPEMLAACVKAFNLSCDRSESRVKWTVRDQVAHEALATALRKAGVVS